MRRSLLGLGAALAAAAAVVTLAPAAPPDRPGLTGTIWVANRGLDSVASFDARTGAHLQTIALTGQPGDLAVANGKLYVGEEFGSPPGVAIVDPATGSIRRIASGPRPHHFHASHNGKLVAYGLYGTNKVGVVDTDTDTLLGEWPASASSTARTHAAQFTRNGHTIVAASEVTGELGLIDVRTGALVETIPISNPHELALAANGKTAYVTCRIDNVLRVVDLDSHRIVHELPLGPGPDTIELSRNGKELTVGLRGQPAQLAVVDTGTWAVEKITLAGAGTTAGHQWTSVDGRWTFAAFEGPGAGIAVVDRDAGAVADILPYPGGGRPHGVAYAGPQDD